MPRPAVGWIVVAMLASAAWADDEGGPAGPRLAVDREVVDVGEVLRGTDTEASFVLRNAGGQALRILKAEPGCGCTVVSYDETIPAGQVGRMDVTLQTKDLRSGQHNRAIVLTTNDPVRPRRGLTLRARIVGSVELLPQGSVILGNGRPPRPNGHLIIRRDPTETTGELRIREIVTSQPWLQASARELGPDAEVPDGLPSVSPGDWLLEVELDGSPPWGSHREEIRFETGLGREPEVTVPVIAAFYPPVALRPQRLDLEPPSSDGKTSGTVLAVVRRGRRPEGLRTEIAPGPFAVRLQQTGERHYKAIVSWEDAGEDTPRRGTLRVLLGDETMEVPVRVAE